MNELINELPWNLRLKIKKEYDSSVAQLEFLLEIKPDKYYWVGDGSFIKLLLFISIFYRQVIDPIEGTAEFTKRISNSQGNALSLGANIITRDDFDSITEILDQFKNILYRYGLDKYKLSYYDVENFLEKIYVIFISEEKKYDTQ